MNYLLVPLKITAWEPK